MGVPIFLACFVLYLARMAPAIALEDSGEFAASAQSLSLTHPPGYPVYLFLGRLAALMPVGGPGFRLALLSASCAALASVLLFILTRELIRNTCGPAGANLGGATAALAFALSPSLLSQAGLADKYPLNALLQMLLALTILRAASSRPYSLLPVALLGGLSLSHHMQTLYLAPAAFAVCVRARLMHLPRVALLLVVLFGLGLSLKPLAGVLLSKTRVSLLYGPVVRAGTLARYLGARDYAERFESISLSARVRGLWTRGGRVLINETGIPVAALAALGIWWLRRKARGTVVCGLAGTGLAIALTASFDIAGANYYLMVPAAFACALGGAALARIMALSGSRMALVLAALALTGSGLRGMTTQNLSRYYGAIDHGRNLLAGLPSDSILVTQHDDDFYPPLYLQRVRAERADVVLVHRPFITRSWYHGQAEKLYPGFRALDPALIPWGRELTPGEFMRVFMRSHHGRRHVSFSYIADGESTGGLVLSPSGYVFHAERFRSVADIPAASLRARLLRFRLRSVFTPYPDSSRFAEVAGVARSLFSQLALRWWSRGNEEEARLCLRKAARYPAGRVSNGELARLRRLMEAR